jgi:hypothetical protein
MKFGCALCFLALSLFPTLAQYDPTPPVPPVPAVAEPAEAPPTPHDTSVEIPHAIRQPIALKVVGSNVKNPGGEYLGRIENIVIDGESGRSEYAMLLLDWPTNKARLTPVPWGALSYVWDQSQVGGVPGALQVFLLNVDKATLDRAPTVDSAQWTAIRDPNFARQIAAFFGPTDPSALGGVSTTAGAATGAGAGGPVAATAPGAITTTSPGVADATWPNSPFWVAPGFITVVDTNLLGTNVVVTTNLVVTNVAGIQTNLVINLTNFPGFAATNLFAGGSNLFRGGTNLFVGGTNFAGRLNRFPVAGASPTNTGSVGAPTGRPVVPPQAPFIGPPAPATNAPQLPPPTPSPVVPPQGAAPQPAPPATVPPTAPVMPPTAPPSRPTAPPTPTAPPK